MNQIRLNMQKKKIENDKPTLYFLKYIFCKQSHKQAFK